MKVLVIPSWFPRFDGDSVGSYFLEQADALAALGHEVAVSYVDFYGWREIDRLFLDSKATAWESWPFPVHVRRAPAIYSRQPTLMASRARRIGLQEFHRFCQQHWTPDVLLSHSIYFGGVIANAIKEQHGIPYVLYEHSSKFQRGILQEAHKRLAEHVTRHANSRLAVSQDLATRLTRFIGDDMEWQLLPNSVDKRFAESEPSPKIGARGFLFTYLGNLVHGKQVDLLLEAFHQAFKEYPEIRLQIVGDGLKAASLKQMCRELGMTQQVQFTGKLSREEVLLALQRSNALVQPSRYETFGVAIIEALALGLPVVAFSSGGPKEIIGNGDGILVNQQDKSSLAKALSTIVLDYGRFDFLSIRSRCLSKYGQTALAKLMESELQIAAGSVNAR